jgi:hypothetical protein
MTTSQYVFINNYAAKINNNSYLVELGEEINRIPNKTLEIISVCLECTLDQSFIAVRGDLFASNVSSNDGYLPCLSILQNNGSIGTNFNYVPCGFEQSKFVLSNTNRFSIGFFTPSPSGILSSDIIAFSIIFKITYPEQGSINKNYTNEIYRSGLLNN